MTVVWVASYPRSGNTFFRIALKALYGLETYSVYEDRPLAENPHIASVVGHRKADRTINDLRRSANVYFVKTHELPDDDSPAIYLARDGRDALVSHAHYVLEIDNYGQPDDREMFLRVLRNLIETRHWFGGWGPNVLAWTTRPATVTTVLFDRLISDPAATVTMACGRAGVPPRAAAHPMEGRGVPEFGELHALMPRFFRRGQAGSWVDEMPSELETLFWEQYGDAMAILGLERGSAEAVPA
jgi:hypothetical protein